MAAPQSIEVTTAPTLLGRLWEAARRIDGVSQSAIAVIFIGWFFIDTLVVSFGSLQHGVRFFDISAAIADPTRIFFGVDSPLQRIVFSLLCIACLLAPLMPHWRGNRLAWAAYLAPFALMVICGALLYSKTSGEFFSAPSDVKSLGSSVMRFANTLAHQGSGLVSKHVSVGVGGYLTFAASLVLAVQGMRRLRLRPAGGR